MSSVLSTTGKGAGKAGMEGYDGRRIGRSARSTSTPKSSPRATTTSPGFAGPEGQTRSAQRPFFYSSQCNGRVKPGTSG